jgi:Tfp pilus assembly protein PilO
MENFSAQYDQLPPFLKIILALGMVVGTSYYYWTDIVIPKEETLVSKKEELEKLTVKLKSISNSLESPLSLEEELAKANRDFKKLLDLLPSETAIERVLNDFASISRITGTEIREFTPAFDGKVSNATAGSAGPANSSPDANSAKIAVKMNGTFSSIVSFIDQAMTLQRIVRIQDFEISNPDASLKLTQRPKLSFAGNFFAFYQKQPSERAPTPQSEGSSVPASNSANRDSNNEDSLENSGQKSMSAKGLSEEQK